MTKIARQLLAARRAAKVTARPITMTNKERLQKIMAHNVGALLKYLAALAVFIFSISLSYSFFMTIAPPDMPWFTWAALGLTEIGLLCWLGVFMMQRHQDAHKTIAFIMIVVCLAAVLFTDAVELARMFHVALMVASLYYYGLIILLLSHFLAFVCDFFVGYFAKYSFYGAPPQQKSAKRAPQLKEEPRPAYEQGYQGQEAAFAQTGEVEQPARKGPGLLVRVAAGAIDTGRQVRELADEKRRQRQEAAPDPKSHALLEDEQAQESEDD